MSGGALNAFAIKRIDTAAAGATRMESVRCHDVGQKEKSHRICPAELPLGRNSKSEKKKKEENKILLYIFLFI